MLHKLIAAGVLIVEKVRFVSGCRKLHCFCLIVIKGEGDESLSITAQYAAA